MLLTLALGPARGYAFSTGDLNHFLTSVLPRSQTIRTIFTMAHVQDREDFITRIDKTFEAYLAKRFPRLHRLLKWYTEERLAKIHPNTARVGLVIMAIILIISFWQS